MPLATTAEFLARQFDYVVIGGGTAGLALAARLSEDPNVNVGVLEAGGYDPGVPGINVPGLAGSLIANPQYDWMLMTVPQEQLGGRRLFLSRGKALGGSSMINLLGMTRPGKAEYNAIESLGNPGWGWDEWLKYHKKSETYIPPPGAVGDSSTYAMASSKYYGNDGPIANSFATHNYGFHLPILEARRSMGLDYNYEPGSGKNAGTFTVLSCVDSRTPAPVRSYSASAYFEPARQRENFLVLVNAQVTRVILERDSSSGQQRGVGVEFVKDGQKEVIEGIKKEAIISAGTFQTPQILELSGIGDPNVLGKYGIECKVPLKGVGENYQDHSCTHVIAELDSNVYTMESMTGNPQELAHQQDLYGQGKGHLAVAAPATFSFVSAHTACSSAEIDEILSTVKVPPNSHPSTPAQFELQRKWISDNTEAAYEFLQVPGHFPIPTLKPIPGRSYDSTTCALMHPFSRGSVHITSADPLAPPAIDAGYLRESADVDFLVKAVRFARSIYAHESIKHLVKDIIYPKGIDTMTDDDLRKFAKETCRGLFHPLGTASMLPEDKGGVVDPKLKVYGTSNIRVVDLSIVPFIISCHTQATAYALAEKAADIIRAEA